VYQGAAGGGAEQEYLERRSPGVREAISTLSSGMITTSLPRARSPAGLMLGDWGASGATFRHPDVRGQGPLTFTVGREGLPRTGRTPGRFRHREIVDSRLESPLDEPLHQRLLMFDPRPSSSSRSRPRFTRGALASDRVALSLRRGRVASVAGLGKLALFRRRCCCRPPSPLGPMLAVPRRPVLAAVAEMSCPAASPSLRSYGGGGNPNHHQRHSATKQRELPATATRDRDREPRERSDSAIFPISASKHASEPRPGSTRIF